VSHTANCTWHCLVAWAGLIECDAKLECCAGLHQRLKDVFNSLDEVRCRPATTAAVAVAAAHGIEVALHSSSARQHQRLIDVLDSLDKVRCRPATAAAAAVAAALGLWLLSTAAVHDNTSALQMSSTVLMKCAAGR
jgi:hypothetical protein